MDGDRFFYLMVVVIALIWVGLFTIPVGAHGNFPLAAIAGGGSEEWRARQPSGKAKAPSH